MFRVSSILAALACLPAAVLAQRDMHHAMPNTLTGQERADGFRLLFDGATTNGWRGYHQERIPDGWRVVDGALTRVGSGGDIVSDEQYTNFELRLQWRVQPGGNSGIMYHVTEDNEATYHSGPEMQVLDDARHADGQSPLTSAGADYGLYPAPRGVVRAAGAWNDVRIVVNGPHVEHWLNGTKVVEYELWSDDWNQRVADSKFAQWSAYGQARTGYIALQDHGDEVAYRSIRIRVLP